MLFNFLARHVRARKTSNYWSTSGNSLQNTILVRIGFRQQISCCPRRPHLGCRIGSHVGNRVRRNPRIVRKAPANLRWALVCRGRGSRTSIVLASNVDFFRRLVGEATNASRRWGNSLRRWSRPHNQGTSAAVRWPRSHYGP
jgi:hypothetical protein